MSSSKGWRPAVETSPELSDAESVTLAVPQALLRFDSEAHFVRFAKEHPTPSFPYLPERAGYNKRLRRSGELLRHVLGALARDCPSPPPRPGGRFLRPLRQIIESIFQTLKAQLGLERHGARTHRRRRARPTTTPRPRRRHLAQPNHPPTRPRPQPARLRPPTPWNNSSRRLLNNSVRKGAAGRVRNPPFFASRQLNDFQRTPTRVSGQSTSRAPGRLGWSSSGSSCSQGGDGSGR